MRPDLARETYHYQRTKAAIAFRRLGVEIMAALFLDVGHLYFTINHQEDELERWADDLNTEARCILCRETPIGKDHEHIEAIL